MTRWDRHLEGWQLAVVVVGSALTAAALAVPRAIPPHEIPLPVVDRAEEARDARARESAVRRARAEPLPFRVRAVGEAIRRFGDAEARNDVAAGETLSQDVRTRVKEARDQHGDASLLALRAVQADLFTRAVTRWAGTGLVERDVEELGGAFMKRATRVRWLDHDGHRFLIEPDGVTAVFMMRWTRLTGLLDIHPFAPSLNEWRLYYRTLIAHPEVSGADAETEAEVLKSYVGALAKRDPDYPQLLARGILDYRLGQYGPAVEALSEHLRTHPSGPWWLRARNYLVAAHDQLPPPEEL